MRSRLPLILIALTMLLAFTAAGCGDDTKSTSDGAAPAPATQSTTDDGSTGADGSASQSAQNTLDKCLAAADKIQDSSAADKAKQGCQDSYDNIKAANEKIDQATSDARAKCEEAANKIPDEGAKASALAACAKFN